jgi:hypothetical protein
MQTLNKTSLAYYVQQEQTAELVQMKEHTKMSNFFLHKLKECCLVKRLGMQNYHVFCKYQTAGHEV